MSSKRNLIRAFLQSIGATPINDRMCELRNADGSVIHIHFCGVCTRINVEKEFSASTICLVVKDNAIYGFKQGDVLDFETKFSGPIRLHPSWKKHGAYNCLPTQRMIEEIGTHIVDVPLDTFGQRLKSMVAA